MTDIEKKEWIDAPVEWDDYPDNPTPEEARAEYERVKDEVENER